MAIDLSSLAGATPWGAAANALGGALTSSLPSNATAGAVTTGPKTINVSGFGGRSSGSATQSLTQAEPDRGDWFPSTPGGGVPDWVLPAVVAVIALGVIGAVMRRK